MKQLLILAMIALLVIGAAYYYFDQKAQAPAPAVAEHTEPEALVEPEPPAIRYPVPTPEAAEQAPEPEPEPLPPLGREGDPGIHASIETLTGTEAAGTLGLADDFIRRFVTTVDGLPEEKVPVRVLPIDRAPERFAVSGSEDQPLLDDRNFSRYDGLVAMLSAAPTSDLVDLYSRYYPLFQEAYDELGYPDAYFNDRLVDVIDHLLQTPDVAGPIELARPHVLYTYADPDLESLSAGQKLLVRVGPDNATTIKQKLREIRDELVVRPATPD